jgi:hypothetical protein
MHVDATSRVAQHVAVVLAVERAKPLLIQAHKRPFVGSSTLCPGRHGFLQPASR